MTNPSTKTKRMIRTAARMRAEGHSWKVVGEKLGRKADSLRNWPKRYRVIWSKAFLEAEASVMKDISSEARLVMQKMLRSADEKQQYSAAKVLMQARDTQRKLEKQSAKAAKAASAAGFQITGTQPVDEMLLLLIEYLRASQTTPA